MAHFSKVLDVKQAFDFRKDAQSKVGYLLSMKIGGEGNKLEPDLMTIKDPSDPGKKINGEKGVFAVLSSYDWDTDPTSAMYFSGQISTENRQRLAALLLGDQTNIEVEFEFAVYEYDQAQKKYFMCANSKVLKGLIEKNGAQLNIDVADDPSAEVRSPQNFAFRIGITPKSEDQAVTLAVGEKRKLEKRWGLKENAA